MLAAELGPDVVLMDLQLGAGIDGVERRPGRQLAACPTTRVVVLTTYDTDADVLRAIEAGAIGYLLKDCAAGGAVPRRAGGRAGQIVLSPPVATRLLSRMRDAAAEIPLTARESRSWT